MHDTPLLRSERARLQHLRRTIVVGILGHGKAMAAIPRLAADLFTGHGFQAARRWADACTDSWVIVCPRHGVITPEQIVEPYSVQLTALSVRERVEWGKAVIDVIQRRYAGLPIRLVAVTSERHLELLCNSGVRIENPLRSKNMGQRVAWFTERAAGGELHGT